MPEGDHFPLHYPGDARPALADEASLRRIAHQAQLPHGSRVLTLGLGGSVVPLVLARELGCRITAFDVDPAASQQLLERARSQGLEDQISSRAGELGPELPLDDAEVDAIFVDARVPFPLEVAVQALRRLLAPRGKLFLVYPVKVGRHPNPAALRFWEEKLGEPLRLPRECLQVLERAGYEPLLIETVEDPALGAFYRQVEQALPGAQDQARLEEEIALYRSQAGRSTVSFALMVGRRKEPGEKPPPSRNE